MAARDPILQQGALEGIGFTFSSGDSGDQDPNEPIGEDGHDPQFPAVDPWSTAIGGTSTLIGYVFTGGTTAAWPGLVEVIGGVARTSAAHHVWVWLRFGMRPPGHRGVEWLKRGLPSSK